MSERSSEGLGKVYAARSADELAEAYSVWANAYDAETALGGYCLPFIIASWIARHVPKTGGPLLDAGCGTGLSGPYLRALGYTKLEGIDFSGEMLNLARQRGAYERLAQARLGDPLPWPDGHFAAIFSAGVFTAGHAPSSSLGELTRITQPGGKLIFTVRDVVLENGGFRAMFKALETANRWRPVEESPPFRAFAVAEPDVLVQAFVFEAC